MPYSKDICGIYLIKNEVSNGAYVGQSVSIRKRISEHFRLLRLGQHPNPHLQHSFNKYGEDSFSWSVEVECEDPCDLDVIENAFLSGEAVFPDPLTYNIATSAKVPMRGKRHTEDTKKKISFSKRKNMSYVKDPDYRKKLSLAQHNRFFSDPKFVEKVKFIVENQHMSYAERGRVLGCDTSAVRRLALRYHHLKGKL